jgi:hypothetical protein
MKHLHFPHQRSLKHPFLHFSFKLDQHMQVPLTISTSLTYNMFVVFLIRFQYPRDEFIANIIFCANVNR